MLNGNNSFYQNMFTSIQNGEGKFLMDTNAPNLATKDITENGTYNASADKVDGYSKVIAEVNVVHPDDILREVVALYKALQAQVALGGQDESFPLIINIMIGRISGTNLDYREGF